MAGLIVKKRIRGAENESVPAPSSRTQPFLQLAHCNRQGVILFQWRDHPCPQRVEGLFISDLAEHLDGREAVTFLKRVKECIENPERMMLEI